MILKRNIHLSERGGPLDVGHWGEGGLGTRLDWGGVASRAESEHWPLPTLINSRRLALHGGLSLNRTFKQISKCLVLEIFSRSCLLTCWPADPSPVRLKYSSSTSFAVRTRSRFAPEWQNFVATLRYYDFCAAGFKEYSEYLSLEYNPPQH